VTGAAPSRRAIGVAALAALAALALAACGTSGEQHTQTVITAIPGRTFIDLVPALPLNLDESGTPDPASATVLPTWSGELVRPARARPGPGAVLPADDAVVPYLATSWVRLASGDYVFRLRRRVRAASGDPLTAADVRWSLERAVARVAEAPFLFALAHIDRADPVTILGRRRVRINVTAPSPFTLSVLASADATIYDSRLYRAHASAADPWAVSWGSSHPASYAAYQVATYLPRREIVLAANPGFWRHPYYQHVIIRQVVSSASRLAAVLAGTATHTSGLAWNDFTQAATVGAADGVRAAILQDGPGVIAWQLNVRRGPLANPLVRQAINLGVNRSELADALAATNDTASAASIPAIFGQAQPTAFDPVQARSLMRAAGYPNGVNVDIYTNRTTGGPEVPALLTFLYNEMIQIGVIMHTVYVENNDQLLALERDRSLQSTIAIQQPLLGGAGFLLEQNLAAVLDPVSPAANEGYRNPQLGSALAALRSSAPGPAANALIKQAAAAADTDLATIGLVTVPVQNITSAGVTGYGAYTEPVTYYEYLHPR
jgi:peptide/nickel transport system substrate-binding protein